VAVKVKPGSVKLLGFFYARWSVAYQRVLVSGVHGIQGSRSVARAARSVWIRPASLIEWGRCPVVCLQGGQAVSAKRVKVKRVGRLLVVQGVGVVRIRPRYGVSPLARVLPVLEGLHRFQAAVGGAWVAGAVQLGVPREVYEGPSRYGSGGADVSALRRIQ